MVALQWNLYIYYVLHRIFMCIVLIEIDPCGSAVKGKCT